jgi:cardiolipin synthase
MWDPATATDLAAGPWAHVRAAGHDLTLFVESGPLVAAMLEDIRAARSRVWLETYIFADDRAGRAIAEALAERARAGVAVRVLYDAVGSQGTSRELFQKLRTAGVLVHEYHSWWEALYQFSPLRILNRRNHRKLLVIDEEVAYFGGMNVVDASGARTVAEAERHRVPSSGGWRDVHVRLTGPQQAEVAESFDRSWRRTHRERILPRPRPYRRGRLAEEDGESLQFFDSGPGRRHSRAARVFTHLIDRARERLTISMAYFLPVGRVLRALLRAARRGVEVRVVVPGESDVPVVQAATRHLYDRLLKWQVRIYERQEKMLHSKVMVVDGEWSLVGSCNLDPRSLWINLEFLAVIRSPALAGELTRLTDFEQSHSREITLAESRARGWGRRVLDGLAWSLHRWL